MELAIVTETEVINASVGTIQDAKTNKLRRGLERRCDCSIDENIIPFDTADVGVIFQRTVSIEALVLNDQGNVINSILIR